MAHLPHQRRDYRGEHYFPACPLGIGNAAHERRENADELLRLPGLQRVAHVPDFLVHLSPSPKASEKALVIGVPHLSVRHPQIIQPFHLVLVVERQIPCLQQQRLDLVGVSLHALQLGDVERVKRAFRHAPREYFCHVKVDCGRHVHDQLHVPRLSPVPFESCAFRIFRIEKVANRYRVVHRLCSRREPVAVVHLLDPGKVCIPVESALSNPMLDIACEAGLKLLLRVSHHRRVHRRHAPVLQVVHPREDAHLRELRHPCDEDKAKQIAFRLHHLVEVPQYRAQLFHLL